MKVIITICSKEKSHTAKDIPAYQRYMSSRISQVRSIAEQQNLSFFILSGKYGLVAATETIPYYDHLLKEDEVHNLTLVVRQQAKSAGITSIEFYAKPRKGNWRPYYQVIERLAAEDGIGLSVKEIGI